MLNKVQNIIAQKALKNQIHNLYIIEGNQTDLNGDLHAWCTQLLEKIISGNGAFTSASNHEDILILSAKEKQKFYSTEDLSKIFQFLHYKATQLPRKFLIIPDASMLNESHYNKLLKTFEEPPTALTTLLINPSITKLLPTILSRGIKIRVPIENAGSANLELDPKWSFTQFSDEISSAKLDTKELVGLILNQLLSSKLNLDKIAKIQTQLVNLEQDMLFHSSNQAKLFKLYNCLAELDS